MSAERFGFAPFREAYQWVAANRKKDVSTNIAGVAGPGIHTGTCVEFKQGKDYTDYIFQTKDKLLHKERCWKGAQTKFKLGSIYQFEIVAGFGTHRIDISADEYSLVSLKDGRVTLTSGTIRDLYEYVKENNFKLVYNKIRWYKDLD